MHPRDLKLSLEQMVNLTPKMPPAFGLHLCHLNRRRTCVHEDLPSFSDDLNLAMAWHRIDFQPHLDGRPSADEEAPSEACKKEEESEASWDPRHW
mmetsp:Transcript_115045/g.221679  ORF Transcript_115045/g.221679 Transcript_115045/m.221679 type:complete len:95 (+) Transcript_115045:1468-1752(+)